MDRDPDALHRDAGRAFARRRVMHAQGAQLVTARRRVRGHLDGEEGSFSTMQCIEAAPAGSGVNCKRWALQAAVIPATAGIHLAYLQNELATSWIPAFAGMTGVW